MNSKTIYSRFKEIADRYPEAPAIIEDDRTVSYSQLDAMADSILSKFYDRAPDYVGIVMSHGAEQIAAMLAVLKSGAGYIPAEPSLPQERIDYMMQNAGGRSYNKRQLLPSSAGRRQRNGRPHKT